MYVYVNGQERELHVYDRKQEKDYAKMLVCAQEQLDTDEYGSFCMTEAEYKYWQDILAQQQESEDIIFLLSSVVEQDELDAYLFEETKYLTSTKSAVQMENLCVKELKEAIEKKQQEWLLENGFPHTWEKLSK
ncbi:hypothetical protein [Megasphaera sp. UPII 135-E]|uniref:hypothetical protein n=1 Tax=Megasphaera sp. UPII 135-E TaxID=1000569 RepID=UPI00021A2FE2|nr:hypothetical protein [Megasphaera sp. UPII 135-E]EGS35563.1 hypothetical protein HMPREF1040_1329 [Megasphaera sp. UPII 135-E]